MNILFVCVLQICVGDNLQKEKKNRMYDIFFSLLPSKLVVLLRQIVIIVRFGLDFFFFTEPCCLFWAGRF